MLPEPLLYRIKLYAPEHYVRFKRVFEDPVFMGLRVYQEYDSDGYDFYRKLVLWNIRIGQMVNANGARRGQEGCGKKEHEGPGG